MWPDCPHMHNHVPQHVRHMPHAAGSRVWEGVCEFLHAHVLVAKKTCLPRQLHPRLLPSSQAALLYSADIAPIFQERGSMPGLSG